MVRLSYLHTPDVLPSAVDPQIRNFLAQLTLELRAWSDEVVRVLTAQSQMFPTLAADPVVPNDGQIWYNTTTHEFKGCRNGAVVTFAVL